MYTCMHIALSVHRDATSLVIAGDEATSIGQSSGAVLRVEVAVLGLSVLGCPFLMSLTVFVDVKQH